MKRVPPELEFGPDSWYLMETDEVLQALGVDLARGLEQSEAGGQFNARPRTVSTRSLPPFQRLWPHFLPPALLFAAVGLSWVSGRSVEGIVLAALAALLIGLEAMYLRAAAGPAVRLSTILPVEARVRRSGRVQNIPASDLAAGDVVLLESGDVVPADIRLLESANLRVDQAIVSGDGRPVEKVPQPIRRPEISNRERHNMLYLGSRVRDGRATGVVTAAGLDSAFGSLLRSAHQTARTETRIEKSVRQSLPRLGIAALVIAGAGSLAGWPAASVAAVLAAGSAAGLTLGLALLRLQPTRNPGSKVFEHRDRLARESLGQVDSLFADAPGLFTQGRARLVLLDLAGQALKVDGATNGGLEPTPAQALMLGGAVLCSNAAIESSREPDGLPTASGDPAEAALLTAGAAFGIWKPRLEKLMPRVLEAPYTSGRGRMSTVHVARLTPSLSEGERMLTDRFQGHPYLVLTRGDLHSLLPVCDQAWIGGGIQPLDDQRRELLLSAQQTLAGEGLRVTGVAFRPLVTMQSIHQEAWTPFNSIPPEMRRHLSRGPRDIAVSESAAGELERGLVLAGLVGILDEPAEGVQPAIAALREHGICLLLHTADRPHDALHTAQRLGLAGDRSPVLTGDDLLGLDPGELEEAVLETSIYSRLTPTNRTAVIRALQRRGQRVAVTGRRVELAPSLLAADVGLAVGPEVNPLTRAAARVVVPSGELAALAAALNDSRRAFHQASWLVRVGSLASWLLLAATLLALLLGQSVPVIGVLFIQPGLGVILCAAARLRHPGEPPRE